MEWIWYLLAGFLGALVLYVIIRMAVAHGIRDSQRPPREAARPSTPPAPPAWTSQDA